MENSPFEFNYCKHFSLGLPSKSNDLDEYFPFSVQQVQSYHPLYDVFFAMNEKNFDTISLNHRFQITQIEDDLVNGTLFETETKTISTKPVFVKFAPLLDPLRFLTGRYSATGDELRRFSKLDTPGFEKLQTVHNASYVDNFFCYLSSQMLNHHGFANAVDYYGSFLGLQEAFKYNVEDDLEYLIQHEYFTENRDKFYVLDGIASQYLVARNMGSQCNKKRIEILEDMNPDETKDLLLDIVCDDLEMSSDVIVQELEPVLDIMNGESVADCECVKNENQTSSSKLSLYSSTSTDDDDSDLNYTDDDDQCDDHDESESSGSESSGSESSGSESSGSSGSESSGSSGSNDENPCYAYLKNYPVQMIFLEKCNGTIDELFEKKLIDEEIGNAALMQIIMILIVFQKCFHMTHNDLHTNNIVWSHTTEKFLYYKFNNKVYKVPTYGRIFKLIDFGRAIYQFRGKTFCSDSFAFDGDAATQYNCEPFYSDKKPRLEPNYAFDLCRLGCSIFDFLFEDPKKAIDSKLDSFQQTIRRWTQDDNGHNILYKRTGEERYEGFKLYKMIARTVHAHRPEAQLEYPNFKDFVLKVGNAVKVADLFDIDQLPYYY